MYDRAIWPEKYDPKTSTIYALNGIDGGSTPQVDRRLASHQFQLLPVFRVRLFRGDQLIEGSWGPTR
jgi:hypothetical protein